MNQTPAMPEDYENMTGMQLHAVLENLRRQRVALANATAGQRPDMTDDQLIAEIRKVRAVITNTRGTA